MPKLVRATTGNVTWKIAPGLALATMNGATSPYPIQMHNQACHHERPSSIMDEVIIHLCGDSLSSGTGARIRIWRCDMTYVLMLKLSAIQLKLHVSDDRKSGV